MGADWRSVGVTLACALLLWLLTEISTVKGTLVQQASTINVVQTSQLRMSSDLGSIKTQLATLSLDVRSYLGSTEALMNNFAALDQRVSNADTTYLASAARLSVQEGQLDDMQSRLIDVLSSFGPRTP